MVIFGFTVQNFLIISWKDCNLLLIIVKIKAKVLLLVVLSLKAADSQRNFLGRVTPFQPNIFVIVVLEMSCFLFR